MKSPRGDFKIQIKQASIKQPSFHRVSEIFIKTFRLTEKRLVKNLPFNNKTLYVSSSHGPLCALFWKNDTIKGGILKKRRRRPGERGERSHGAALLVLLLEDD